MSQAVDISLSSGLVKDLREAETYAPAQTDMRNVRYSDAGNTIKRRGYSQKWDTTVEYPVSLLIPENDGYAYTQNGDIYSLGSSIDNIYTGAPVLIDSPQWIKDGNNIIVVNGTSPIKITNDEVDTLGGSPPDAKFISKISSYTIMSGYHDTEFSWSTPGNAESWPADNFANIQKTGKILNQVEYKDRLLFFKEKETEVWNFVGGSSPFVRYPGGKISQGLGAKNSVVKANDRVYWFGNEGDFYVYEGGIARVLSDKMRRRLDVMNNLDSLKGYDIRKENCIMWINPEDGVTFLYDYSKDIWLEDARWESAGWQALPFSSYMELNRKQYFGSRNYDGLIHEWSDDYKDDNGQPIRAYRRFKVRLSQRGHRVKVSSLLLRREGAVATASVADPVVAIRWRFDKQQWSKWRQKTLGAVGKHDPCVKQWRLGYGRDFEVEISESDAVDFVMTNAIVTFEEMTA